MSTDISADHVVVCIPAKNEAGRIGALLRSLCAQTMASAEDRLKVVLVCNNSSDGTAAIARGFASRLAMRIVEIDLPANVAHVGTARRLAMDQGADWLDETEGDGVLISTDADAIAPPTWVGANCAALANADVVGGRLVIAENEGRSPALRDLHRRIDLYWAAVRALEAHLDPPTHDPSPRHGDHTGASLALRASLYRAVGGLPAIPTGEDRALVAAIERRGGRVRHCPAVSIMVSARVSGRADGGMAADMARREAIAAGVGHYAMPVAAFWEDHFRRRAAWRAEWTADMPFANARAYVAHRQAAHADKTPPMAPVETATEALETLIGTLSEPSPA